MEARLKGLSDQEQTEKLPERLSLLTSQRSDLEAERSRLTEALRCTRGTNTRLMAEAKAAAAAAARELEAATAERADTRQRVFEAARQHRVVEAR